MSVFLIISETSSLYGGICYYIIKMYGIKVNGLKIRNTLFFSERMTWHEV